MTARERRLLLWLQPWLNRGYTIQPARRGGHYKVLDPHGRYVTSIAGTPRNPESPRFEVGRILARHHAQLTAGGAA